MPQQRQLERREAQALRNGVALVGFQAFIIIISGSSSITLAKGTGYFSSEVIVVCGSGRRRIRMVVEKSTRPCVGGVRKSVRWCNRQWVERIQQINLPCCG
ncbi:unnamed protein product [Sphagnum jensenii]|jgi:hypothetical protein|uniref:Uncharacterized protein n=1 Tax=Sphagnum jensenii TaxID=128206 RepID=A0ABP1BCU8_9BRYO